MSWEPEPPRWAMAMAYLGLGILWLTAAVLVVMQGPRR